MYTSLLLTGLVGCGGGMGADNPAADPTADATAGAESETPDRAATAVSLGGGVVSRTPAVRRSAPLPSSTTSNGVAVGSWRQLNAYANLAVSSVPEAPPAAAAKSVAPISPTYYIDSAIGNDQNTGNAPGALGQGKGPWRTLGRLMQASLKPGDTIQLACGSSWRETLRLPANGTAGQPIRVVAPAGCTTPPAIDGSVAINPSNWKLFRGNIYQATLESTPLQLTTSTGTFTEAHHPNRVASNGVLSSPYLKLAGNGNTATVNGRTGSTVLPTGADLVVPNGIDLAAGARIRVRSAAYIIDEASVQSFKGHSLVLSQPTSASARAGGGYLLLGQLWMLDSAGEWHYEPGTRQLFAWMPEGQAPSAPVNASVLATAVDLSGRQHVVLDSLAIRNVGTGLDLRKSSGIQLRNSVIEDIVNVGINASASVEVTLESNTLSRIGTDAITGQGDPIAHASGLVVRNNLIRDSGVVMRGEEAVSLPRRSLAAIVGSTGSVITGNTIINAGYIGILLVGQSQVESNFVIGACSVQDDCGGIYTGGANNNSTIRGNTVARSRGMLFGLPQDTLSTSAQGIYVDDEGSGVRVEGNTVVDADFGIHLHNATGNTVKGNLLYSNRRAQIWMQEDSKSKNPKGDLSGNTISANVLAPTSADAFGIFMTSPFESASHFATFDNNRYLDRHSSKVAVVSVAGGSKSYSAGQWSAVEGSAWVSSSKAESAFSAFGASLLPGWAPSHSTTGGWYSWNATTPTGRLFAEACGGGTCLRYVAGGSAGVVSSPGFAVKEGNWYKLSLDVATEQEEQTVPLVVRIGGADYGSVSDRNLSFTAGRTIKRYTQVFQATRSIDPNLGTNGSLKARIDIDGVEAGRSISIGNVELVQVVPVGGAPQSVTLLNAGAAQASLSCPFATTLPVTCTKLYDLADDKPVNWPVQMSPRTAMLLYTKN